MPLSPLVVVIGVVFILSLGLLLLLALEERFDEKTASEFEHDVAYHTMLMELRDIQRPKTQSRPRSGSSGQVRPLYENNVQAT